MPTPGGHAIDVVLRREPELRGEADRLVVGWIDDEMGSGDVFGEVVVEAELAAGFQRLWVEGDPSRGLGERDELAVESRHVDVGVIGGIG